jgi:hypothetical protein
MSLNDFNRRARIDITIDISGSGQFSPLTTSSGSKMNWSLAGNIIAKPPQIDLTTKEETCGLPYGSTKEFRRFELLGSTGNTSGTVETMQLPRRPGPLLGQTLIGTWTVNTEPVLSAGGKADDAVVENGYYVVGLPEDTTPDDPIDISPAIDFLTRVYPGDFVYVTGKGEFAKWSVAPKYRYPQTDRTFPWEPNTSPVLASGGIADGELALPGTIMLPTADFYIEDEDDAVDGMRYFYANQGVYFDGQRWGKNLPDPIVYTPETGQKEFRNIGVVYISLQRYEGLFENDHATKLFVFGNQTVDDEKPAKFTVTPEGGEPEVTDLFFRWDSPGSGYEPNIQPTISAIHDFGDAWSHYYLENRAWLNLKFPGFLGAGFTLKSRDIEPEYVIPLGVNAFEDGNITTITNEIEVDGEMLTNTFSVTLILKTSLA